MTTVKLPALTFAVRRRGSPPVGLLQRNCRNCHRPALPASHYVSSAETTLEGGRHLHPMRHARIAARPHSAFTSRWIRTWCVILPVTAVLASGCATVTVATGEGQITARGMFGTSIQTLTLAPVSIRRQGIGVHQDRGSITLGWLAESAVYEPSANDACRIVLFESNPAQLAELISVLRHAGADMTTVCSQPSGE